MLSIRSTMPRQIRGLWLAHANLSRDERAAIGAESYRKGEIRIEDPTIELLAKLLDVPTWAISEAVKLQRERDAIRRAKNLPAHWQRADDTTPPAA